MSETTDLKKTMLHDLHLEQGAKMMGFAGYDMPVHYPMGILAEHNHTRTQAGLFDVSHMGQAFIIAQDGQFETAAAAMETLVPADIKSLKPGQQRYTQLLGADGGILDDLMISRMAMPGYEHLLYIVVNAGCKDGDYHHIAANLPDGVLINVRDNELSLIALQGPKAVDCLAVFNPEVRDLVFMSNKSLQLFGGAWAQITRSGYTGEDGFEISMKHEDISLFTRRLQTLPEVELIGLGARDSLRMEAGLCLYGHEVDTSVSPVQAGLTWSIPKHRRCSDAGYVGAARVASDLADKSTKRLVGILPDGRAPAREGTQICDSGGQVIGQITSGGFGPTVGGPVAMGYVARPFIKAGTPVQLMVRGKARPAKVVKMPFTPHNYFRGAPK